MIKPRKRKVLRGEKHHWWPKSLSKFWVNERGLVNRIEPCGKLVTSTPKEFGHISDGHNILYSRPSAWESTIEDYFDLPDSSMAEVVEYLESFKTNSSDYGTQENDSDQLNLLRECMISLLVRTPKYRNSIEDLVTSLRGELPKAEAKMLISSNVHQNYKQLLKSSYNCGRLAILFSRTDEFIYGDGLYTNLTVNTQNLSNFKAVIPFTPNIVVVWCRPMAYRPKPKVISAEVSPKDVKLLNDTTQIYSKDYIFYRTTAPEIHSDFKLREHRMFSGQEDPVREFINQIIPDTSFRIFGL